MWKRNSKGLKGGHLFTGASRNYTKQQKPVDKATNLPP